MIRKTGKKTVKNTGEKHKISPDAGENLESSQKRKEESAQAKQKVDTAPVETEQTAREETAAETVEADAEFKLAELNDKYIRLLAEYDNYRKRTAREIEEIIIRGAEKLIIELLPILDNLDRATEHKNDKTTLDEYVKGITLIEDQFRAILARSGLEPIIAVGEPFDPNLHDAMMQIESEEHEAGIVTSELEKGYMFAGKVIRHSKVVVSK